MSQDNRNPKMEVVLGNCVAGFQPSEKLCKKLKEDYNWNIYLERKSFIEDDEAEEVNEHEEYYGREEEIEAIRKQVYIHEDSGKSVEYFFFADTGGGETQKRLRTHEDLVEAVKELGDEATVNNKSANIAEIPPDIEWYITENEPGYEWIAEKHRTWSGEPIDE